MISQRSNGVLEQKGSRFRRGSLVLLAFVYLFIGLAHSVTCVDLANATAIDGAYSVGPDGGEPGKATFVADHCHFVAITMPATATAGYPAVKSAGLIILIADLVPAGSPHLDTPPPKDLI
jgi:hypothetical protein